ncbi:MAG: GNAT family N-acetyltransferase [Candidatus Hodarchaeales archaeon]|jgi:RimJ/RimL family protein N-acetyltransferase
MQQNPFENEKIRFRPFTKDDTLELNEYLNHPALLGRRNVPWGFPENLPLSADQIESIIKNWLSKKKGFCYAIEEKSTGNFLGHVDCDWNWDTLQPSIAVTIKPSMQNNTFGSQTVNLALNYIFNSLPTLSVSCWIVEWNQDGLNFAKKHKFKSCGRMRRAGYFNGKFYDYIILNMLRKEWEEK